FNNAPATAFELSKPKPRELRGFYFIPPNVTRELQARRTARRCLTARRKGERQHAKTVLYCSLETPRAASQSQTAVYSGDGVAPRSVNSWRCFASSFISVVLSSAT